VGGFKPSRSDIDSSTSVGADITLDSHQFTGSVDITGSLTLNGSAVTGGGGGGGAVSTYTNSGDNRVITSVNSNTINGEENFTFDGTDLSVSADADITSSLGRTAIGGAGLADAATVSHIDHNTATNFGFRQRANGQTEINAKSDQSINLKLGSQNKLTLNSSGFVGIGENISPEATLHVSSSTGEPLFRIDHPDVAHPDPILYITGSGEVGIGTITPTAELHVSSSTTGSLLRVDHPDQADRPILFVTGTSRIGIGTAEPGNSIHVRSSGKASLLLEADTDNTPESDTAYIKLTQDNNATRMIVGLNGNAGADPDGVYLANAMSNAGIVGPRTAGSSLQFCTSNRAKVAITDDGQMGVGDGFTESNDPTAILHISGGVAAQGTAPASPLVKVEYDDVDNILFVTGTGHIGVGTAAPTALLHISSSSPDPLFRVDHSTNSGSMPALFVSGNGLVGIGTDAPRADTADPTNRLHILGEGGTTQGVDPVVNTALMLENNNHVGIQFMFPTGRAGQITWGTNAAARKATYYYDSNYNRFNWEGLTYGTSKIMDLAVGGDCLNIGSSNAFHMRGAGQALANLHISSSTGGTGKGGPVMLRLDHEEYSHPHPVLFVTASGRLGIGNAEPAHALDIRGGAGLSGSLEFSGTLTTTSLSTLVGQMGLVNVDRAATTIDVTGQGTNTMYTFGIANGTITGQRKDIFMKIAADGTIDGSNSINLTGSNIASGLSGASNGSLLLTGTDGGGGSQFAQPQGGASLMWDGSDWLVLSLNGVQHSGF